MTEKLIFETSRPGTRCFRLPRGRKVKKTPGDLIPSRFLRASPANLPEIGELELVRHYTRLSSKNMSVTNTFYPLGSCTMKYNPEAMLRAFSRKGLALLHPLQDEKECQGILSIMKEMEEWLGKLSGLPFVTLQPSAGAHGELTALLVIKKALEKEGKKNKNVILVPDSAHGTNPASSTMAGLKAKTVASDEYGLVSLEDLGKKLGPDTAAIMITNPNTLGLFEKNIKRISEMVHEAGGYVYMDGANFNAIIGRARPGDFGVDAMHFNLHKTFGTPHGMGGPGSGPIAVKEELSPFLPVPRITEKNGRLHLDYDFKDSIGSVRGFYGNAGVIVMAWVYLQLVGKEGISRISKFSVLNARYLLSKVSKFLDVPYSRGCMHEFVASAKRIKARTGVTAMDMAKALIDRGFHPPTVYFPLIVGEALMVEPTETETMETLDAFARALEEIVVKAEEDPESLKSCPTTKEVSRPDEVKAVKEPRLRWHPSI